MTQGFWGGVEFEKMGVSEKIGVDFYPTSNT